jgi:large subunit ribosomal protein L4
MKIDVYTAAGKKKGSADLPAALFEAPINDGLMHLAFVRQQSNRRLATAHKKTRSEVVGSTRKIMRQKGSGRARKGSASANILRGGNKCFAPRNIRNFTKDMPKKMRRNALFSCLSAAAKKGTIIGLEGYGDDYKTKTFAALLENLPVAVGRKIVFVLPSHMEALERGAQNVQGVKTILAQYLNPEDVLGAYHLVFLVDALKVAEDTFGGDVRHKMKDGSALPSSVLPLTSSKDSKSPSKKST